MNQFNNENSSSNHHINNENFSNLNSLYKTYSPYPTSTSTLNPLATFQDSNSAVDDIVPQVNDTYGIYHTNNNHHQQPRGNHNNYLSYGQQQQQQDHLHNPDHPSSSCTPTVSTTNVKSVSFLTDYSTANTNNNQDSVHKRSNYRQNQDGKGK